jgi:hypothetical protein
MWSQHLQNEGQPCILFNAWENDFSENPLVTFMGEINAYINEKFADDENLKRTFDNIKEKAGQFFKKAAPIALKMATRGAISGSDELKDLIDFDPNSAEEVATFLSKYLESELNDYENKKDSMSTFKERLSSLANSLIEKKGGVGPLIIFIDELDRCRPNFALELLENIKHLFDVDNIVFILTVDKDQLKNSVRTLYGKDMEAEGYLRRFIDLAYEFERPDYFSFTQFLCDSFKIKEILQHYDLTFNQFRAIFALLSDTLKLSLRDQSQCFTLLNVILRTMINSPLDILILVLLVSLRFYNEIIYKRLISKNLEPKEILDLFDYTLYENRYYADGASNYFEYLDFALNSYLLESDALKKYFKQHEELIKSDTESIEKYRSQSILKYKRHMDPSSFEKYTFPMLKDVIEMTSSFRID